MNVKKYLIAVGLSGILFLSSCSMSGVLGKNGAIGGTVGGVVGSTVGALVGSGTGAIIGSGVGSVVGTTVGASIGTMVDANKIGKIIKANAAKNEAADSYDNFSVVQVSIPGGILFPQGSWTLSEASKEELGKIAYSLVLNPNVMVSVVGYTDDTFDDTSSEEIATNRAYVVAEYLMGYGIPGEKLYYQGLPRQDYVASNDTESGRAQNRRVEIYIYQEN